MKINHTVKEWLESFLYAFIALFVLFFLCWPFRIDGESMTDTLHNNDRIVVSRLASLSANLKHGDMAVCTIMMDEKKEIVVKRIVGLPGDHIQIIDGMLYLNETVCSEPYLGNTTTIGQTDIKLAEDEYFVLGDNRDISLDSRIVGPIKRKSVVGKVIAKWYPFADFESY